MIQHPLTIGTRIRTLLGDQDTGDDDEERIAAPGEIGEIVDSTDNGFHAGSEGWRYGVIFYPSNVWVFLESYEVDDPNKYEVLTTVEDELHTLVSHFVDVMEEYDAGFPITNSDHPHHEDHKRSNELLEWLRQRHVLAEAAKRD